jgi:glycosyltransferase involved in cell wall biosynthesis
MSELPRVLIIAESANPNLVSVPLVGWSHSVAIAAKVPTLIVTQVRNKDAFLAFGLREGLDFVALDTEWIARPLNALNKALRRLGLGWTMTTALRAVSCYFFDRAIVQRFEGELQAGDFGLVHRVTPLSPTIPSPRIGKLCRRAGVPFVVGPLNGGVPWPKQFRRALRAEGEWLSYVRSFYKLLPGYRTTLDAASAIVVGSRDTLAQLPDRTRGKCVYIVENAVEPERFSARAAGYTGGPLKVCFVGRLVPYKGADMMLEALAGLLRAGSLVVDIYGDGPQRGELEGLVDRLGVSAGVRFRGWVEHSKVQHEVAKSDLFVFPSIREFGGGVVLEAMAVGVVPVVVGYGGPGELVDQSCGYVVPLGDREHIVEGVRKAAQAAIDDPASMAAKRDVCLRRVAEHFTWERKASKTLEVYRWVLGLRSERPDLDDGFSSMAGDPAPVPVSVSG